MRAVPKGDSGAEAARCSHSVGCTNVVSRTAAWSAQQPASSCQRRSVMLASPTRCESLSTIDCSGEQSTLVSDAAMRLLILMYTAKCCFALLHSDRPRRCDWLRLSGLSS